MNVFFYGLFMDEDLLKQKGVNPMNSIKAYAPDYALHIGNRASLVRTANEKAYGLLMLVNEADLNELYAEESVADYVAEEIQLISEKQETITAFCYNLPESMLKGSNTEYAQKLYKLCQKMQFPAEYLQKIEFYLH